jgi:hypothetical protein
MNHRPMPLVAKRPVRPRPKRLAAQPKPVFFWRNCSHPELDASGDWLLKNLAAMRAQAMSRAVAR